MSTERMRRDSVKLQPGGKQTISAPGRGRVAKHQQQRRYQINWLLLAATIVVGVILVPSANAWHNHQVKRNGSAFLQRAEELEAEGKWEEAANSYFSYVRLSPEGSDADQARIHVAQCYDRCAKTPVQKVRAVELYSTAIGLAPDPVDLRRRRAELYFELGRYDSARYRDALGDADKVLLQLPEDPTSLAIRARCTYLVHRKTPQLATSDVRNFYEQAILHSPNGEEQIGLALGLAQILRVELRGSGEAMRKHDADMIIDGVVAKHPESIDVWIGRYRYRSLHGELGADADLDRALALDTKRDHVLARLLAGERALRKKQLDEAVAYFEQAKVAAPTEVQGYYGLGRTYLLRNELGKAIDVLNQGIKNGGRNGDTYDVQLLLLATLMADAKLVEAKEVLDTLDGQIAFLAARNFPHEMMARRRSVVDAFHGQWHVARGEYGLAVDALKRSLATLKGGAEPAPEESARHARNFVLLGRCYLKLGNWDEAAATFTAAGTLQPDSMEPVVEAARAWREIGNLDKAARLYQQAAASPKAPAIVWTELADVLLRQQLAISPEVRNWKDLEDSLQKGHQAYPESLDLKMLQARVADLRGGSGQTLDVLEKAYASQPESVAITERLIMAYEGAGRAADADRVMRDFEGRKHEGQDAASPLLTRTLLLAKRGQFDEAEKLLRDRIEHVPPAARPQLELRLAVMALRANRRAEARSRFAKLAEAPGADPRWVSLLADLALDARDFDDLARWEKRLREREGAEGTMWQYYKAQRLLAQAENTQDFDYSEVKRIATYIVNTRPLWSAGHVLRGQIAQRQDQPDVAIGAYQEAIEYGERRPVVFERLTKLLIASHRFPEATKYVEQLGNSSATSSELAGLAVPLYLRQGNLDQAIAAARKNVELHKDDPTNHVWLGHSLLAAGKNEEAEAAFRRAVELAPDDVRVWHGLFSFLVRTKQIPAARDALEKIGKSAKMTAQQRPLVLAQGYELLGDRKAARENYEQALQATPADASIHLRAAEFFAVDDTAKAEECYRLAVKLAPKSRPASRGLIAFLIARGDERKLEDAALLLKQAENEGPADASDQRLKVLLNLRRGGVDHRKEARRILVDLVDVGQAQASDRLLLASVLEGDGQGAEALEQLRIIASRDDAPSLHLVAYVEALLRNNRPKETGPWLDRLSKIDPNALAALALRVRTMVAMGKSDDAAPLIDEYLSRQLAAASSNTDKARLYLSIANLCQQVGFDSQTERCFRSLQPLIPSGYAPLANWLANHKRTTEAVDLCLAEASSDATAGPATALARILMVGSAASDDVERAQRFLSQAMQKFPDDPELIFAVATWRFLKGDSDEALTMFRKVLALQPKNVLARNNLASLLAERPSGRQEALQLIEEAIAMTGKNPELLDTKGLILLREGRLEPAIELFQEATSTAVSDPRHLFHLSLAYRRAENFTDARKALERARGRSLTTVLLSPDERQLLPQLERDLLK